MTRIARALVVAVALLSFAPVAGAQPARTGRLMVTAVDQSRLVVPGATITVVGLDAATKAATIAPAKSSEKGVATFEGLPPGRYSISAEFPGFEIGVIRELQLKAGDNRHVVVLRLARLSEEVTVGRDPQTRASDRGTTFGSALTREQIEALSDDPDEMARQLNDMAGVGAVMRVDSFEGAQLPPKAMIKAIHITRDSFAAENHSAGSMFIDIITQPGVRPMNGAVRFGFYDSGLDGANPLVPKKGPAQTVNYSASLGGTLDKDRSGYGISVSQTHGYTTPNLYAATPNGLVAANLNLRMPRDTVSVSGSVDYALTRDQTLRVSGGWNSSTFKNQGVGAYDLLSRAYGTTNSSFQLRVQEAGPLGRRFFINTRLMVYWSDAESRSAVEAPTISVIDAFTTGGAQRAGGRHTRSYTLQSDLDYVRGIHSWRAGITLDGGTYRTDDALNYLGTYTFESLEAYEAGLPRTFTRRIGDPDVSYVNWQAGFYVQDDIRLRKNLTLSPGVRIEAQTHMPDYNNVGPRIGVTWAPFKSGKTTLRFSAGRFYDWLSSGTYEQTLRVDGERQQELNIVSPSFPYDPDSGVVPPTNKYLLGGGLDFTENDRLSAGIDHQFGPSARVNVLYADTHARGLLVGRNLNAPVNGVRPDPSLANTIEAVSEGRSHARSLSTYMALNLAPKGSAGGTTAVMLGGGGGMIMISGSGGSSSGPRFSARRGLTATISYTLAKSENDVDGAFSVPPSGTLATEWGPSGSDTRHRVYLGLNSSAVRDLSVSLGFQAWSGTPYSIRTGYDDNGDLIINDRPPGVGRNTLRSGWQWNSFGSFSYRIGIGKKAATAGSGIDIATIARAAGVAMPQTGAAPSTVPRYVLSITANVQNLFNHANFVGYSGTMTSPFFMKPTMVDGVRTVNLSASFSF
jgi:hypothetical protein